MNSKAWKSNIRGINNYNNEIFDLKNGHWQVRGKIDILLRNASFFYDHHLDLIKNVFLKILSDTHPMFDLKPEDRFASTIYGKYPKYSPELRKGISETLVFLGIYGKELKHCTLHKPEETVFLTIRELFNKADWRLWASLNDILPILAEAAPDEFMTSVETALKQSPCPFDELFKQEKGGVAGTNYMTGLYWALETLAWSEEHLSRAILILAELAAHDPGGKWANRPAHSIITILLPWLPQTMASVEKRVASLRGIQRNFPEIAWKIVIELLPKQHQASSGSHKPKFRNYIPADWKKGTSPAEYWEQVGKYAVMVVDMAKNDIHYILELVDNLDNIPQPSYHTFLEYLSSDEIIKLPDEQRTTIWEKMISLVGKHRYFPDAEWALPTEAVDLLEQTAKKISPSSPEFLYRHLFSSKTFNFKDRDEDWQAHEEKLLNQRSEALKQIYEIGMIDSVVMFAGNVENPTMVGDVFARIAKEDNDFELLPSFLGYDERFKKQFIQGYIWARYRNEGIKWINDLRIKNWTTEQKCNLFLFLPFENDIWGMASEFLNEHVDCYWKKIDAHPFPAVQGSLLPAIENLLKYGRPCFALYCIYTHYFSKKEFFREQAIKALTDGISSDELIIGWINSHQVIEIIKMLQNDVAVDENDLYKIEWLYLPLFSDYNNSRPKLLEKYLSQKSDFFIEVIQLVYRSKKEDKSEEKISKRTKNLIENAWKLLRGWKRPPGKMDDGSFSDEALKKWVNDVKTRTTESGHFEIAMEHLGRVLFYVGADSSGLWIRYAAAEILDENDNDHIRLGFSSEVYNSRGGHFVDPSGKPEKELANLWRRNAEEVEKLGLIRFSSSLKNLAHSYDREAERVIYDHLKESEYENNELA